MKNTIRKFVWLALCGSVMPLAASPPVIGVARSWGAFFVNDASVPGSATVFDGTSLKTADASSNLNLTGGERVTLASNTTARIYATRLLLDRGTAEFGGSTTYRVEARNLRVGGSDAGARIRVAIDRQNRVLVASLGGAAEVRNARGILVARVPTGAALALSAANADTADLTGVVQEEDGKFYLTDDVTKVKVQLSGNVKQYVGKQVHVTGTIDAADAAAPGQPAVVTVASATQVAGTAGAGGTAGGGTGGAAGAGVAGGSFPTLAVVGGTVATVGGTVGGLAASGVIGSGSTVSR